MGNFKKYINFVLFTQGTVVSLIGNNILSIVLPLYIYETTKSATLMGVITIATIVPKLLSFPFAGFIGDNYNRKHTMIVLDVLAFVINIFMCSYIGSENEFISIVVFSILSSIIGTIFSSSTAGMLGDIVEKEDMNRLVAINQGVVNIATLLSPIFGTILFGSFGILVIFVINAVTFLFSAFSELFIKYKPNYMEIKKKLSLRTLKDDFIEVKEFLKVKSDLVNIIIVLVVLNFIITPMNSIVLPFSMKEQFNVNNQAYGLLGSVYAGGMLLGNIILGVVNYKNEIKIIRLSIIGLSCLLPIYGVVIYFGVNNIILSPFIFVLVVHFVFGIMVIFCNTPLTAYVQKNVPTEIKSRFFSIVTLILQGMIPVGSIVASLIIENVAVYYYFLIMCVFIVLIWGFVSKRLDKSS